MLSASQASRHLPTCSFHVLEDLAKKMILASYAQDSLIILKGARQFHVPGD
ncbi:MAG: hypothetical protein IPP38_10065 [Bacteroidetes bacterium]|nr:hypothetical protein [Bacteroidota bacterium]